MEFIKGCLRINEADRFSWHQVFHHPVICPIKSKKNSQIFGNLNVDRVNFEKLVHLRR